jgi:L-lactate utilization protein LutC
MDKMMDKKAKIAQMLAEFLEEHQAERVIAPKMKNGKLSLEELKAELKPEMEGKEKEEESEEEEEEEDEEEGE